MTDKTRKQRKAIPTFTWLMRRLDMIRRKNPEEFHRIKGCGYTTEILKGVKVRCGYSPDGNGRYHEHTQWFTLYRTKKNGECYSYATIGGFKSGDEFYTLYRPLFSATEYSMRMHKYLPFDLPEGSCSAIGFHYTTPFKSCVLQNADGSFHSGCRWYGGRRGKPGYPEAHKGDSLKFVIRDRDGAFVGDQNFPFLANFNDYYFSNPIDIQHGFLPGSCDSKIQWYDSMANSNGLWNADKMRTMAARVHSEAIALTKKYPHLKIALYPMEKLPDWDQDCTTFSPGSRVMRFDRDEQMAVVVGRDSLTKPIRYWLPRIVLYWTQPSGLKRGTEVRYIRATIPPVGCQYLLRDKHNSSCFCKVHALPTDPNLVTVDGKFNAALSDDLIRHEGAGRYPSMAYHSKDLICLAIGKWGHGTLGYSRMNSTKHGEHDADALVHDWNQDQNVVVVHNYSADEPDDDPKYEQTYAARPSGVFSCIEERELLDSLPLV